MRNSIRHRLSPHFRTASGLMAMLRGRAVKMGATWPLLVVLLAFTLLFSAVPAQAQTEILPAQPTGLRAVAGDGQATLEWTDPGDASITSYEVRQREGDGEFGDWGEIPGSGASTTSHTVSGLTNGTEYNFQIRAVNDSGSGAASDTVTATPRIGGVWSYAVVIDPATITAGSTEGAAVSLQATFQVDAGRVGDVTSLSAKTRGQRLTTTIPATSPHLVGFAHSADRSLNQDTTTFPGTPSCTADTSAGSLVCTHGLIGDFSLFAKAAAAPGDYDVSTWWSGQQLRFTAVVNGVDSTESEPDALIATGTAMVRGPTPAQPTGVTVVAGDGQVTLEWTDPGDASITSYEVRQREGDGEFGDWGEIPGSGASTSSHTVSGLTNGTEYGFQVRAVNDSGNGAASNTVTATPASPPAQPTGLSVEIGDSQVALSWDGPSDASITGHQYSQNAGTDWTDIPDSAADETNVSSYIMTGLTNGTPYTFAIRAGNDNGISEQSDSVNGTPVDATSHPAMPTGFSAEQTGVGRVRLRWEKSTSPLTVTGYQYTQDGGLSWNEVPDSHSGRTSAVVADLTTGTTYHFALRALNSAGPGEATESQAVTLVDTPAEVTGFTATAQDGQVWLTWDHAGNESITGWEFWQRRGNADLQVWALIQGSNADTASHLVEGLDNGQEYRFRVRSVNPAGKSRQAKVEKATPTAGQSNIPLRTRALSAAPGGGEVTLTWLDPNDSSITKHQYGQDGAGWTDIPESAAGGANTKSYTVTGLTNGTAYTFQVRAVNNNGNGPASESATAMPEAPANNPPAFSAETADRSVAENALGGTNVGLPVSATDADNDTLTYSLSDTSSFAIDSGTGQITVGPDATLDYESGATSYSLTVSVHDGKDADGNVDTSADDTIAVTINLTDVPIPEAPNKPTVTPASVDGHSKLEVQWDGVDHADRYDLQYRESGGTTWSDGGVSIDGTTASVVGLTADTTYDVQVRASNVEGIGEWSDSGTGTTSAAAPTNTAPTAGDDSVTTNEDTAVDIDVVTNDTDPDPGTSLEVTAVTVPSNGTAAIKTGSTTLVTYTPSPGLQRH